MAARRKDEPARQSVNTAFSALRTLIPTEPADRKLSKIETLRLASSYISHLGSVLVAGTMDLQPCFRSDESDRSFSPDRSKDPQRRPRVCTFCLAMHRKYNLSVSSQVITSYKNQDGPVYIVPTSAVSCVDPNCI
ncbi:transcription factor 15 isoform X2 [Orussus abietinus]|uniref:transcription factor 15 isoform X2 n=1 Tax=Orussus abietinus TaxID=222816 RepID=UPI0006262307|nr:transcription factor 15 isoform X2 [Orussus abietinus]